MKQIKSIKHSDGSIEKHFDDGTISWYKNGEIHRTDGHAVEFSDGTKKWLINGKLHREEGPAMEWADGRKYWYLNDKELSEKEFNALQLKKELTQELPNNGIISNKIKI